MNDIPKISAFSVLKNRNEILKNPLPFHHEYFEKYGDTFQINLGKNSNWIFTRNSDIIVHILQKNQKIYQKSELITKDLAKYIGRGILTSNGDFWRAHRRMLQPAFHKKKLESLLHIMQHTIKDEIKPIAANTEQDIYPLMGNLAFQVVAQSLFSADDIRNQIQKLKEITIRVQEMLVKEMRLPYLKWWFQLNGSVKKHLQKSAEARKILNNIIQKRVDEGQEKDDLLDMLLNAKYEDGTAMTRDQLIDEVMVLFTAGHETTANALSFILLLIAQHHEKQNKLFQEVSTVDFDADINFEQLNKLKYTKQCIEEAMRLYPPLYIIDRISKEADTINDIHFKKDTVWLLSFFELHRNSAFWDTPNAFIPERFNPENKKDFSGNYFPFGAGPRMCIGNNFAMYEMILTVAILVKKFKLTTKTGEIELNPMLTLKPSQAFIHFAAR